MKYEYVMKFPYWYIVYICNFLSPQAELKGCGDDFLKQLASTSEQLLLLLDSELTVDDVITGSKSPGLY